MAELSASQEELRRCQRQLAQERAEPFQASDIIWLFGAGRTGSTWLSQMLEDLPGLEVWPEPQLGELFDAERFVVGEQKARHWSFALSPSYKEAWLPAARSLILAGAQARFPAAGGVVIKEPHGSAGAPLLVEALPESRIVLLVRDPRDVVASALDARMRGMWREGWRGMYASNAESHDEFVESAARAYARHMGASREAHAAHGQSKTVVRYEDLRWDTLGELMRLCSELGVAAEEKVLARTVGQHSWETIPEDKKGEGKFYRKGTSGGWQQDLTEQQIEVVEKTTAPILREFYPK